MIVGGRAYVAVPGPVEGAASDLFDDVPPPFDLTSDMVLAAGTCPAGPLRTAFPGVPFATLGGRALLGVWFARVDEIGVGGGSRRASLELPGEVPYRELNVAVPLRDRSLFVPGIYATSRLSLRLGRRYGMPKRAVVMSYAAGESEVVSHAALGGVATQLRARALSDGRGLATLVSALLPTWSPRAIFPRGSWVQARLQGVGRVRVVWLTRRRLNLDVPWLPRPVSLWPLALHVIEQRMRLPAP